METIEKKTAKKKMSTVIKFQDVKFFISCYSGFLTILNNVVPPTLFNVVNNIVQHCGYIVIVRRTNVSFFDPSLNDQRTEHSCA